MSETTDASAVDPTAPTLVERALAGLPAVFRDCLDRGQHRYTLDRPWLVGDHVYATNAEICCRMPASRVEAGTLAAITGSTRGPDQRFPESIDEAFLEYGPWEADPIDLPDVGPADRKCRHCRGEKMVPVKTCDSCGGDGRCSCLQCGADHPCGECDGTGHTGGWPCKGCNATGIGRPETSSVKLSYGMRLDRFYVAVLREHGATVYPPIDRSKAFRFTTGDVEGVVMPLKRGGDA